MHISYSHHQYYVSSSSSLSSSLLSSSTSQKRIYRIGTLHIMYISYYCHRLQECIHHISLQYSISSSSSSYLCRHCLSLYYHLQKQIYPIGTLHIIYISYFRHHLQEYIYRISLQYSILSSSSSLSFVIQSSSETNTSYRYTPYNIYLLFLSSSSGIHISY